MNTQSLFKMIQLLESKFEKKRCYKLLAPFKFDSSNPIELQEACKKIAEHLGLNSLIFIVSYCRQNQKVAGNINLNSDNHVYIEISDIYKSDSEIVLSILAHELCHKFLYINNIRVTPEIQNEILTDITTVYTGLGKLSLNGCEKSTYETIAFSNVSTRKKTISVGYINRQQFAYAYKLLSERKNISYSHSLAGLSVASLKAFKVAGDMDSEVPGSWLSLFGLIYKSTVFNYFFVIRYISE